MKKNQAFSRALCILLACVLAVCMALPVFAGTPAEDAHLHFDDDGKFRILNFSDFQDTTSLNDQSLAFARRAVLIAQPDLIVLTGDNIYGTKLSSSSDTRPAITSFMSLFETLGVPVAIVFGNHDDEGSALSKEQQMAIYNSFSVSVSYDEGASMSGCGTYNVPIYGSTETDTVKYNLWMFDTGSNASSGYDHMRGDQLDWYVSKSNELKAANGGNPVPSIAFQHIIVKEIYDALKKVSSTMSGAVRKGLKYYVLPDNAAPGSVLGEAPCPSDGGNEFSVARTQGDIRAIVCGHDHVNQFVIPYQGIDLICTPTAGFYSYGNAATRGARVIEIDEQTGAYSTYMINLQNSAEPEYHVGSGTRKYVKDVAVCYAQSAQCGSVDNAITQAYNRVFAAVDAANGNGVAIREDLNGGETNDSTSGNHYAVCMGYTLTENPAEAMRGLGLFYAQSGDSPTRYSGSTANGCVWTACGTGVRLVSGSDGAVNVNIGTGGDPFYLYATYDSAAGDPLTELRVVNTGSDAIAMSSYPDYSLAYSVFGKSTGSSYADLNKTARGDYVYALYRAQTSGAVYTQIDSFPLRQALLQARLLLTKHAQSYTADTRETLRSAMRQVRSGILRDLDDDHRTTAYDQQAVNTAADLLHDRIQGLTIGYMRVTFDANGGACSVQKRAFMQGVPIRSELPQAARSRYLFNGWYTLPEGGTRIDTDTVFTTDGEMTVFAQWLPDGFWIAGDADLNGSCDVRDVTLVMRYLAGGWNVQPDFDHADVNMDGVVNLRDVALLRRFLAGGWGVSVF